MTRHSGRPHEFDGTPGRPTPIPGTRRWVRLVLTCLSLAGLCVHIGHPVLRPLELIEAQAHVQYPCPVSHTVGALGWAFYGLLRADPCLGRSWAPLPWVGYAEYTHVLAPRPPSHIPDISHTDCSHIVKGSSTVVTPRGGLPRALAPTGCRSGGGPLRCAGMGARSAQCSRGKSRSGPGEETWCELP